MKTFLGAAVAISLLASPAWADNQRGFYAGLGYAVISGSDNTAYDSADMPVVELSAGYKHNAALGLEARWGTGLSDDRDLGSSYFESEQEENADLRQVEREIDQYTAIYYRPELTNDQARLYGLLGYAEVDAQATSVSVDDEGALSTAQASHSVSGVSYGLGVGWYVDQRWNFNLEYRRLASEGGYRFEAFSAQLDYRF